MFVRVPFNLSLPPRERWAPVIVHLPVEFHILRTFVHSLETFLKARRVYFMVQLLAYWYRRYLKAHRFYAEYLEEMEGFCRLLQCSCSTFILLQFIYEFGATCTSILFRNYSGEVCHFRTLDWKMPILRNLTFCMDVSRNGVPLYQNITFLGYLGLYTAQRNMGDSPFSLSLNYRPLHDGHRHDFATILGMLIRNIARPFRGYEPNGFALRHAIENCASYPAVVQRLETCKFSAPCYLMIAGASQATRLVRTWDPAASYPFSPWHTAHLQDWPTALWTWWHPAKSDLSTTIPLIQTNMDPARIDYLMKRPHLQGVAVSTLLSFERWQQATDSLRDYYERKIDFQQLVQERLLTGPILNAHTAFWCLFHPATGKMAGSTNGRTI